MEMGREQMFTPFRVFRGGDYKMLNVTLLLFVGYVHVPLGCSFKIVFPNGVTEVSPPSYCHIFLPCHLDMFFHLADFQM